MRSGAGVADVFDHEHHHFCNVRGAFHGRLALTGDKTNRSTVSRGASVPRSAAFRPDLVVVRRAGRYSSEEHDFCLNGNQARWDEFLSTREAGYLFDGPVARPWL